MTVPEDGHLQPNQQPRQARPLNQEQLSAARERREQQWRIDEDQHPDRRLHTSLLLELPGSGLESAFWKDDATVRAYCRSDLFTMFWVVGGNLLAAKSFGNAMSPRHFAALWPLHVAILTNLLSVGASAALLLGRTQLYKQHRYRIAVANRVLRLVTLLGMGLLRTPAGQAVIGEALNTPAAAAATRSQAVVALTNLARPLYWSPMMAMGQGMWVFAGKHWLPLQVLTHILVAHCQLRFQPCRLVNDAHISRILQATCHGFSRLHRLVLGLLLGSTALQVAPLAGGADDPDATCSDLLGAARLLSWYCHAAYVLLVQPTVMLGIEWRLKARWVRRHLGRQLVYGPAGWPASGLWPRDSFMYFMQRVLSYIIVFPTLMALAWFGAAWLVPRLPHAPCRVACLEEPGGCPTLEPSEGWLSQDPGLWSAALLYAEILAVHHIYAFLMRYTVGMLDE